MQGQWASKPFDLRPQDLIDHPDTYLWDVRAYECITCGNRLSEQALDGGNGLCPRDGGIMRPLGRRAEKHAFAGASR